MPAAPTDEELATAVLRSVESGGHPDSETVATAKLAPSSLPAVLKKLTKARDKAREDLRAVSRNVAPDVDGWIEQTRQLQADIEASKAMAQAIVKQAQEAEELRLKCDDASKKAELLRVEVDFNNRLGSILQDIRDLAAELGTAQDTLSQGNAEGCLRHLQHIEAALVACGPIQATAPIEILQQRTGRLRANLIEKIQSQWDTAIVFDKVASSLTVSGRSDKVGNNGLSLNSIVEVCSRLDLLDANLKQFCRDLDKIIISPCLEPHSSYQKPAKLVFGDSQVSVKNSYDELDEHGTLQSLADLVQKLHEWMPFATSTISDSLTPSITSRLLNNRLNPAVPTSVERLADYQTLLAETAAFTSRLSEAGWTGVGELQEWSEQAPRVWLAKRREASLEDIRAVLQSSLDRRKTVEHVETQVVAQGDVLTGQDGTGDEWNDWHEDDAPVEAMNAEESKELEETEAVDEGAWGWDDDNAAKNKEVDAETRQSERIGEEETDESAAWGWDEQDAQEVPKTASAANKGEKAEVNGSAKTAPVQERELTLRESYTTTGVPEEIQGMIAQIAADAQRLKEPELAQPPVADAANGLYAVPTLALAGFRALAPTFYQNIIAGNMLLYNDSMRLSKELNTFAQKQHETDAASGQPEKTWPSSRMKLDTEIAALESFGRRAYGKEMDSQRTVLRDLLDDTQGFANCAEAPFASECESAISRTAERIRVVAAEWHGILSHSALLQSLGSLLSTVINKMIADIEDMSDIAEDESKQLRKFCNEMCKLSDLFRQDGDSNGVTDVTGFYTPNWLKFQYLSEIMESSLADIRYLWTEGELSLEFEADELEELITALFAESDLRRKAIAELRRS